MPLATIARGFLFASGTPIPRKSSLGSYAKKHCTIYSWLSVDIANFGYQRTLGAAATPPSRRNVAMSS